MEFKFDNIEAVLEFAATVQRVTTPAPTPGSLYHGNVDPAAFVESLARVASGNGKISAIRLYRAVFEVGLKEAKEAVERIPAFQPTPTAILHDAAYYGCGDDDCCPDDDTPF